MVQLNQIKYKLFTLTFEDIHFTKYKNLDYLNLIFRIIKFNISYFRM